MQVLQDILEAIGSKYQSIIDPTSEDVLSIDLGQEFRKRGFESRARALEGTAIIVPVNEQQRGWPVEFSGLEYRSYFQLESGIAIPVDIAIEVQLPCHPYRPKKDMTAYYIPGAA